MYLGPKFEVGSDIDHLAQLVPAVKQRIIDEDKMDGRKYGEMNCRC